MTRGMIFKTLNLNIENLLLTDSKKMKFYTPKHGDFFLLDFISNAISL